MIRRLLTLSSLALISSAVISAPSQKEFTITQTKAIEKIVHNYLLKNPDVLVQAVEVLRKEKSEKEETRAYKAIKANVKPLFHDPGTPSAGAPNASVYIAEFFDYQCGHCRAVAPEIKKLMASNKNVRVFFKELPIFGGASKFAAKAALASQKQGKYVAFHNALFSDDNPLDKQSVLNYAKKAGLNISQLSNEMNKPQYEAQLRSNFALAEKLGIMGTPAFVISNKAGTKFEFFPGAVDKSTLEKGIEAVQQ